MDFSLSIGLDEYISLKPTAFAQNDASGFDEVMGNIFEAENHVLLLGSYATYTNIEYSFKKLLQKLEEGDRFFFFFAGHGANFNGIPHISAYDSIGGISQSWHNVVDMVKEVNQTGCNKTLFFIDACESTVKMGSRLNIEKFSIEEFKIMLVQNTYSCVFSSCSHKGAADVIVDKQHGIWSYFLLKALKGEAKEALSQKKMLTNVSLKNYLNLTVKDYCKKTKGVDIQQSFSWGKDEGEFLIKEFSKNDVKVYTQIPKTSVDRVQFVTVTFQGIKNLSGFKKGSHTEPKFISGNTEKFIDSISQKEVEEHIDEVSKSLVKLLGLRRRDFKVNKYPGDGEFVCPYLSYNYEVSIDESDLSQVKFISRLIPHDVGKLIDISGQLDTCFPKWFDFLLFTLNKSIDISALIDKIEDSEAENLLENYDYEYDPDCTCLELKNEQLNRIIIIKEDKIEINFNFSEEIEDMLEGLKDLSNQMFLLSPEYKLLG